MSFNSSKRRRLKKLKQLTVNSETGTAKSKVEKKKTKWEKRKYRKSAHKIQNQALSEQTPKVCKFVCCKNKPHKQFVPKLSRRERKKQNLLRKTERKKHKQELTVKGFHTINIEGHFIFDINTQSFKIIFISIIYYVGNFKFSKEEIKILKDNFMKKLLKKQHHCAKNPKKSPAEYSSRTSMKVQVSI